MIGRLLVSLLTQLVRGYQLVVSPWFAPTCRYYPSCSQYAIEALKEHGAFRGSMLSGWRILRCNPWSKGGVDHVVPKNSTGAVIRTIDTGSSVDPVSESDSSTSRRTVEDGSAVAQPAWRTLHGNL